MGGQVFPHILADSFMALWLLVATLLVAGSFCALRRLRREAAQGSISGAALPPLTILKPLKGVDDGAKENLESFFLSRYPKFELLFSVASAHDPILPIMQELQEKYPQVVSRIYIGDVRIGLNPKVNNLVRSYSEAAYDNVLISDSNTRVDPDFLVRIGAAFSPDVALLHCVVAGSSGRGLGGQLDSLALNTVYARGSLTVAATGHACVTGKAMLLRKSQLEKLGGLAALSSVIAEDYVAGQIFEAAGLRVKLHSEPIRQQVGRLSFRGFWSRNIRWGRIRKGHAPILFFTLEPFIGSVASGLIGAMAFWGHGVPPWVFFPLHMAFWGINDLLLMHRMGQKPGVRGLLLWGLREFLQLPLWLHISLGNSVNWRGQRFVLGANERREAQA